MAQRQAAPFYMESNLNVSPELAEQIIQINNFKYGLVLLITSFILLGGLYTIYLAYRNFTMDVEGKVFTNIFAFIMLAIPLYFWIDSVIMIVKINCYQEYFILTELARIANVQ